MYLFETFGGWCKAVKRLFYQMKEKVRNKLSKRQHEDEATWSTEFSVDDERPLNRRASPRRLGASHRCEDHPDPSGSPSGRTRSRDGSQSSVT